MQKQYGIIIPGDDIFPIVMKQCGFLNLSSTELDTSSDYRNICKWMGWHKFKTHVIRKEKKDKDKQVG